MDKSFESVKEYVESHFEEIIEKIGDEVNYDKGTYDRCEFCPEGTFEIESVTNDDTHFCMVVAKGIINIARTVNTNNGLYPDESEEECDFCFFVDKDSEGNYSLSYNLNEHGETDWDATFIVPDLE